MNASGELDRALLKYIRSECAAVFDEPEDFDYFSACYHDGEPADEALLRLFREEQDAQPEATTEDIVETLIYG